VLDDQAFILQVSMAVGSTNVNDAACEVFEARVVQLSAISAGQLKGVTPELLSKIWSIPFDNAARTLNVTAQLILQDPNSLLSRNASMNDRAVWY
jgi:hypothetical protein